MKSRRITLDPHLCYMAEELAHHCLTEHDSLVEDVQWTELDSEITNCNVSPVLGKALLMVAGVVDKLDGPAFGFLGSRLIRQLIIFTRHADTGKVTTDRVTFVSKAGRAFLAQFFAGYNKTPAQ